MKTKASVDSEARKPGTIKARESRKPGSQEFGPRHRVIQKPESDERSEAGLNRKPGNQETIPEDFFLAFWLLN
jgi:hypothetical protein